MSDELHSCKYPNSMYTHTRVEKTLPTVFSSVSRSLPALLPSPLSERSCAGKASGARAKYMRDSTEHSDPSQRRGNVQPPTIHPEYTTIVPPPLLLPLRSPALRCRGSARKARLHP